MRRIILFILILCEFSAFAMDLRVAQAFAGTGSEPENPGEEIASVFGYNTLNFEILDNSEGKYSTVWENVVVAKRISTQVNSPYIIELDYPDILLFNGKVYGIVAVNDILSFAAVEKVTLPYEMRFVEDKAFFTVPNPQHRLSTTFTLPPATASIGLEAFKGLSFLQKLIVQAPFPPECVVSENESLNVGDISSETGTPFPEFESGCTLAVPEGSRFFYRSHPCFSSGTFKEIIEVPVEDMWKYILHILSPRQRTSR